MKIFAFGTVIVCVLGWGLHGEAMIAERTLQQQMSTICPQFWAKESMLDQKTVEAGRTACPEA